MSGYHSHGGGSGGAHSHGSGSAGDPVGLILTIIIGFAIVFMITGSVLLGKFLYEHLHGGRAIAAHGSWGSMYLNMGWGAIWAAVMLLAFLGLSLIPAFRRKAGLVICVGIIAAVLALIFGGAVATHFGHKVGVTPW